MTFSNLNPHPDCQYRIRLAIHAGGKHLDCLLDEPPNVKAQIAIPKDINIEGRQL